VSALIKAHADGKSSAGINIRKNMISDMQTENVLQPLLVTLSAMKLATECARALLRIDDVVPVRGGAMR
jgi:T-complex protein 1 subunit delta